jgi:hypothetical protein
MKKVKEIPFYPNTGDGMHCVQACFKSILKYFLPEQEFSWEQLDKMSKKIEGKGTWWYPFLLEIQSLGLEIIDISPIDLERFYKEGENYLRENYTQEVVDWMLEKSNLLQVKKYIPEFLEKVDFQHRTASFEELEKFLKEGYLVGVGLNSRTLNNKEGYSAHMVVIFECDDIHIKLHDPGFPAQKNREVSKELFMKAWEYEGKDTKSLVAIRKS